MYGALAPWWPLLSPPADYAEEARRYEEVIDAAAERPVRTLLELGSGGGSNASHLKARYTLTLVDRAPAMLAVSRALNPECEHLEGDMRRLRLGRTFDAVFIHDAIDYVLTESDLAATIETAALHLAPGGALLLVPDDTAETYMPDLASGGADGADGDPRAIRYAEWRHPAEGSVARATFVYMLREGPGPVHVLHEEHLFGLFPRATWLATIEGAGLAARALPFDPARGPARGTGGRELFVGVRPR